MGFLQDFKEYRDLKKGKIFLTNDLYVGKLGSIYVHEYTKYNEATFCLDKYVIIVKASAKEVDDYLCKKYGTRPFTKKPDVTLSFENPERTSFFKLITFNNRIIPQATPRSIIRDAEAGVYEVISIAKTLSGMKKNPLVKFSETMDLASIKDLEELINNTKDFSM